MVEFLFSSKCITGESTLYDALRVRRVCIGRVFALLVASCMMSVLLTHLALETDLQVQCHYTGCFHCVVHVWAQRSPPEAARILCVCLGTINSWISLRWCAADIDPPRRTVKAFDFGALSGDTLDLVTRFAPAMEAKNATSGDEKALAANIT